MLNNRSNRPWQQRAARRIAGFSIKRWFLSGALAAAPAYLAPLIQFFGKDLGILDASTGALVWPWGAFFLAIFALSFVYVIISAWAYRIMVDDWERFLEDVQKGQRILKKIIESVTAIVERKRDRFCSFVAKNLSHNNPFPCITQPREQIKAILYNLRNCLSSVCGIQSDAIGVSIIYRPSYRHEWTWLEKIGTEDDLELEEIITNNKSTALQIMEGRETLLFFADKRNGINSNQYIESPKDKQCQWAEAMGSILCQDISIKEGFCDLRAILSISTYGIQLCEEDDDHAKDQIVRIVLKEFVARLRLELALLYAKEHVYSAADFQEHPVAELPSS